MSSEFDPSVSSSLWLEPRFKLSSWSDRVSSAASTWKGSCLQVGIPNMRLFWKRLDFLGGINIRLFTAEIYTMARGRARGGRDATAGTASGAIRGAARGASSASAPGGPRGNTGGGITRGVTRGRPSAAAVAARGTAPQSRGGIGARGASRGAATSVPGPQPRRTGAGAADAATATQDSFLPVRESSRSSTLTPGRGSPARVREGEIRPSGPANPSRPAQPMVPSIPASDQATFALETELARMRARLLAAEAVGEERRKRLEEESRPAPKLKDEEPPGQDRSTLQEVKNKMWRWLQSTARIVVGWGQMETESTRRIETVPSWQSLSADIQRPMLMGEFRRRVCAKPSAKALFYRGDPFEPSGVSPIFEDDWIFKEMMKVVMNDITDSDTRHTILDQESDLTPDDIALWNWPPAVASVLLVAVRPRNVEDAPVASRTARRLRRTGRTVEEDATEIEPAQGDPPGVV
ncbi:hypothetical protein QFC21_006183 [Naganishia friedmannii]|uniref:Uncharacterized protein n=1 Tax=Naganishia friedmannii TaxID=89922 RepID=A0ACC2V671_9TREE|nr:hypothetical protein QFC21_006183 [Naganishia friedmannii]